MTSATGAARPTPSPTSGSCGWRQMITRPRPGTWSRPWPSTTTSATGTARSTDRNGQANALTNLGLMRLETDDYPAAAGDLEQALAIYHDIGPPGGQVPPLNQPGTLHRATGELPKPQ